MKKRVLIYSLALVVVVAWGFFAFQNRYTIKTPYDFSGTENMIIPREVEGKMTTAALLDTFLEYPHSETLVLNPYLRKSFITTYVNENRLGLGELVKRTDVWQAITKRYRSIDGYKSVEGETLSFTEKWEAYSGEIAFLETLAANNKLGGDSKHRVGFEKEVEKKHEEMGESYMFEGTGLKSSTYYRERSREITRKKHYGWIDGE